MPVPARAATHSAMECRRRAPPVNVGSAVGERVGDRVGDRVGERVGGLVSPTLVGAGVGAVHAQRLRRCDSNIAGAVAV